MTQPMQNGTLAVEVVACASCRFLDHPAQQFGCQQCGAHGASLGVDHVPARGVVVSYAEVNLYGGSDISVPFVVAAVQLDSGPVVRVTMLDNSPVPCGSSVVGVVFDGELRFVQGDAS